MIDTVHIVVAMKPIEGGFAENALKHGVAGINVDGCRVGLGGMEKHRTPAGSGLGVRGIYGKSRDDYAKPDLVRYSSKGRWPSNVIFEHSNPVKKLDDRSGDQGGASRFFKTVNIFYD